MSLSIEQQDNKLREAFPQFSAVSLSECRGIWEGEVSTANQTYQIRIDFELPPHLVLRYPTYEYYPRVYILAPHLQPNHSAELGPLPHVWYDRLFCGQPNLCLFHPRKNEWNYNSLIAETTLPDACEWLHAYDIWLLNGRWYGGGENHTLNTTGKDNNDFEKIRRDALSGASEIALAA